MLADECRTGVEQDPHALGTVKLVDFGIARSIMGDIKAPGAAEAGSALTRTGMVLGTPPYASPEQLAGEPLDARSDLYSLGLIAFEALTGVPAFATTNARELIAHRLLGSPRAVTDVLRDGDAPWADAVQPVLDRALSSDPAKRYADAMTFATEFAAALGAAPHDPECLRREHARERASADAGADSGSGRRRTASHGAVGSRRRRRAARRRDSMEERIASGAGNGDGDYVIARGRAGGAASRRATLRESRPSR
jgi:serine/threonine-protein kinase